jgi:hypothetical protein
MVILSRLPMIGNRARGRARFFEFFAAQIRNRNTRSAYLQAGAPVLCLVRRRGLELREIQPLNVAAYIE